MLESGDRREILLIPLLGVTTLDRGLLATGTRLGLDVYEVSTPDRREAITYVPPPMTEFLYVDAYELMRI